MMTEYSVLMSVYHKEDPAFLKEAMRSILTQTVPTNDFVLVCDGPLTAGLDAVIAEMEQSFGGRLHVVRLPVNGGLGNALNTGIAYCKNELIARMDSDDISYPDRCECQLRVFAENPKVDIVSGTVEEFSVSPDIVDARRMLPETQEKILRFARSRTPFNHPCVMYRRSAVEKAGGYKDFYLLEDYYLWVRMLLSGAEGYNLGRPLLHMRAGSGMYLRRSGVKYARSQIRLFAFMKKSGFITEGQFLKSAVLRAGASLMPNSLRRLLYKKVLRK